jgi:hypothetical protein
MIKFGKVKNGDGGYSRFWIFLLEAYLIGTCPVPPKLDRRGQGAQYERKCLTGKPSPMGEELQSCPPTYEA